MPITFQVNAKENYFISELRGNISDQELVDSFTAFYESDQWSPGMNELTMLCVAEESNITKEGLMRLAIVTTKFFKKHHIQETHTAVYAPDDLTFGVSRMYEMMIKDSPETYHIFRDLDEAKLWLASLPRP